MTARRTPLSRPLAARWRGARGAIAAAALGALVAAGQAPLGLWWLALPALGAIFALVANAPDPRAALRLGWFAGAGHFAAALFWIVEPFLVDPVRHGWMAPFALLLMAGGLALFWAIAAGLAHWLGGARPALRAAALAPALAMAELLRGHVFTGFPWAMPGHVWLETPVAQLAALIGASGLTLAMAVVAALPMMAGAGWLRRGLGGGLALALLVGAWFWGDARRAAPLPEPETPTQLRIVQPNAAQHLKWDPDWARIFLRRQLDATAAPAAAAPIDLVIWSETAIPWLLDDAAPVIEAISEAAAGVPVALGVQRRAEGRFFNSLALIDADGETAGLYDKHHLVPFGEYVPFAEAILGTGYAGFAARQLSGYSPGPGPRLLDLGQAGRALPLICYEAVFPRNLRATERPDWVLQVTNDAWFGRVAGPYQHLAQARFRAIEMGLPVVRAANTGVSAVIDARGEIRDALGLGEAGHIDAALPARLSPTPFARMGEAPLAVLLAVLLAGFGLVRLRGTVRTD